MPKAIGGSPWLNRDDVCEFGQFAVEPDYQNHGIGAMMVQFVENLSYYRGMAEICLDTSEKAFHLIDWYRRSATDSSNMLTGNQPITAALS